LSGEITYLTDRSENVGLAVDQVLTRAQESSLSDAMVLGVREDGTLYFETSIPDGAEAVWLLEKAKHLILTLSFEQ
jgi:hypothetical protein